MIKAQAQVSESDSRTEQSNPQPWKWSSPDTMRLRSTGTELHFVEPEVRNGIALARITKDDIRKEVEFWSQSVYFQVLGANPLIQLLMVIYEGSGGIEESRGFSK